MTYEYEMYNIIKLKKKICVMYKFKIAYNFKNLLI